MIYSNDTRVKLGIEVVECQCDCDCDCDCDSI